MSSSSTREHPATLPSACDVGPSTPSRWSTESLGNLFTLQLGKMLNEDARSTHPKFPYLGNKDVQWGRFDFSDLREMHFNQKERQKFQLVPGDLLVCEGGEIGRTAIWTGEFDCYYQKAIHRLRVRDPMEIEPRFVLHFMQFAATEGMFANLIAQSSIAHLTRTKLGRFIVPVPPLPEQRKIAAILSSVDDAVEKTQGIINQMQVVKHGLMQELLTRGLPGRHTRFKKTEIGERPVEWKFFTLLELAVAPNGIQTGPFGSQLHASEYIESGVPVIMPKDMVSGCISDAEAARISEHRVNELARYRVQAGDLLFARRGDIGRAGLVTQDQEGWICGTGCFRFRPRDAAISGFLRHWVEWPFIVRWLTEHSVGQTMPNLNSSILGRLPVALPPEDERTRIGGVLDALFEQMQALKRELRGFQAVKRSLMSVLLTGELRVTPDC